MDNEQIFERRVERIRKALSSHKVQGLVFTNFEKKKVDIHYATGFTGSYAACLLTENEQVFITDGRYGEQAPNEVSGWDIKIVSDITDALSDAVNEYGIRRLGIMEEQESAGFERKLLAKIHPCETVLLPDVVREVRAVKDEDEVGAIREAVRLMETMLKEHIYPLVRPGITDRELATELRILLLENESDIAFDPIVLSGAHSAIIHGNPFRLPDKEVKVGEMVQFDVGCIVRGYVCDISRVVVCGKATEEQKRRHGSFVTVLPA